MRPRSSVRIEWLTNILSTAILAEKNPAFRLHRAVPVSCACDSRAAIPVEFAIPQLVLPRNAHTIPYLMNKSFAQRIAAMNAMYKLPAIVPRQLGSRRRRRPACGFTNSRRRCSMKCTRSMKSSQFANEGGKAVDIAVAIADLLGDIIVYCRSEALKYGLPLEDVLDLIMDSNESKLGAADGKPRFMTRTASSSRGRTTGSRSRRSRRCWRLPARCPPSERCSFDDVPSTEARSVNSRARTRAGVPDGFAVRSNASGHHAAPHDHRRERQRCVMAVVLPVARRRVSRRAC